MKSIERFKPQTTVQPWGLERLLAEGPGYTLKLLSYKAGMGGGLQYHIQKTESFYVLFGSGLVGYDRAGQWVEELVNAGSPTCHIQAGAPHQFTAITDCEVVEASTPGTNDRVNVAERYGRRVEPGTLPTTYTEAEIVEFENHV